MHQQTSDNIFSVPFFFFFFENVFKFLFFLLCVFLDRIGFADWLAEAPRVITPNVQSPSGPPQPSQFWPEPRGDLCVTQFGLLCHPPVTHFT